MQPSLKQMVEMLPEAKDKVGDVTRTSAPTFWAEYIVKKCYDEIRDWRWLVEDISDALRSRAWGIGEIDREDTVAHVEYFISKGGEVTRRDRESILRTFLEGVFNTDPWVKSARP